MSIHQLHATFAVSSISATGLVTTATAHNIPSSQTRPVHLLYEDQKYEYEGVYDSATTVQLQVGGQNPTYQIGADTMIVCDESAVFGNGVAITGQLLALRPEADREVLVTLECDDDPNPATKVCNFEVLGRMGVLSEWQMIGHGHPALVTWSPKGSKWGASLTVKRYPHMRVDIAATASGDNTGLRAFLYEYGRYPG